MAEVPVKKTVKKQTRKTTTKRVVRSASVKTTGASAASARIKRNGPSLKIILLTILFLFLASGGAFYIGYSAEGAIDINERLSDDATRVDGQTSGEGGAERPAPLKERPKLEPAAVETPVVTPAPAADNESSASTTDDTSVDEGSTSADAADTEDTVETTTEDSSTVSESEEEVSGAE